MHTQGKEILCSFGPSDFFVLLFKIQAKGHCLPLNARVHSSIFNDKAVCSPIKRLASLRHNLMDQCVLGAARPPRITLYCVVVRLVGCCGAHTQTR